MEGGGGGHQVMWGRVLWRDYKIYSIVNITKYGQIIVFLRPLYKVWNTTALIYARLQDTDTGQREEEEEYASIFLRCS